MITSVVFKTINKLIIIVSLVVLSTSSCKSKKAVTIDTTTHEQVETENNTAFKSATIIDYSKKNDACTMLILLDEDGSILQPINIPEELRKDGMKVWVSFTYSRRQQGPCTFGSPITIDSIKIKE